MKTLYCIDDMMDDTLIGIKTQLDLRCLVEKSHVHIVCALLCSK